MLRCVVLAGALVSLCPGIARAQVWIGGSDSPRPGSLEFSGGAVLSEGLDLGDRTATLTRNPGTGSGPFELFTSSSRLDAAPAVQGRLAVYLARSVAVEGGAQYSRPKLRTRLTNDAEAAESITASSALTRYIFDGSLVVHLLPLSFAGGRGVPFVLGGGGYIRELHEGNELVETGQEIHAGAGLKYWFGTGRRRAGLRGEAGVSLREGGFDFSDERRTTPTASVSFVYLF